MKKFTVRLTACVLSAMMLLSLAACSNNGGSAASSAVASAAEEVSSAVEEADSGVSEAESEAGEAASQAAGSFQYDSIDEFLASDEVQSMLDSMKSSLGNDTMEIDVVGEGSKLIYNFTYLDLGDQDPAAIGSALAEALSTDSMKSTFGSIANSLKEAVNVVDPSVVVNYLAPDGSVMASQEFAAE